VILSSFTREAAKGGALGATLLAVDGTWQWEGEDVFTFA
jgi:hypothetical protein